MEGISKERLESHLKRISLQFDQDPNDRMIRMLKQLIMDCTELNPSRPIDENTPKEFDVLITDKSKRKYIGKLFSSGVWCVQGKLDFLPTHWKELSDDPK